MNKGVKKYLNAQLLQVIFIIQSLNKVNLISRDKMSTLYNYDLPINELIQIITDNKIGHFTFL